MLKLSFEVKEMTDSSSVLFCVLGSDVGRRPWGRLGPTAAQACPAVLRL